MTKRIFSAITLFLLTHFLIGCALIGPRTRPQESRVPIYMTILAEQYPEVLLKEKAGPNKIVKLLKLEGGKLACLPSPYWNVQPEEIDLEEISSLKLTGVEGEGAVWFLAGAFSGFYLSGISGLISSTYNVDYEDAETRTFLAALSCGFLGWAINAILNPRPRTKFDFSKMSATEKVLALKNIMGAH